MSTVEAWDEVHKNFQWGTCPEPAVARWAMRRWGGLDKDAKGRIRLLDVGCGVGAMAFWLVNNGFLVDAIDSSQHAIKRAEHLYGYVYPHSLKFAAAQIEDFSAWGEYDGVVDVCCLQHVDDLGKALDHVRALLKPGGCLFSIMACKDHSPVMRAELAGTTFHRLSSLELDRVFGKWQLKVESMTHTDNGNNISHWVVQAIKP